MQDFYSKRKALFACLDDASKELIGTGLDQSRARVPDDMNSKRIVGRRTLSRMRGKESIFKKPELPLARCLKPRKEPDYQLNPHKWKKYSLAEVDISDQTNMCAAFTFLKQMDTKHGLAREFDSSEKDGNNAEHKIEFKKSCKIQRRLKLLEQQDLPDIVVDKSILKGTKVLMPEYVVGGRTKEKKPKKAISAQRAVGTLTLSHLQEESDDDNLEEG